MIKQPAIEPIPGPWWRTRYLLTKAYVFDLGEGRSFMTVPVNFRHDGSSEWLLHLFFGWLPFWGWIALIFGIRQDGPHRAAALVHDYLKSIGWDRADADKIFARLCLEAEMPDWQVHPRWAGLRVTGWYWWGRSEKDNT